jgi:hypothetical protein
VNNNRGYVITGRGGGLQVFLSHVGRFSVKNIPIGEEFRLSSIASDSF